MGAGGAGPPTSKRVHIFYSFVHSMSIFNKELSLDTICERFKLQDPRPPILMIFFVEN